jgi:hypothetical protein
MPIIDWLLHADHDVDPICRSVTEANQLALSTFRRWSSRLAGRSKATASASEAAAAANGFLSMPIRSSAPNPAVSATALPVEVEVLDGGRVRLYGQSAARIVDAVLQRLGAAR